MNVHIRIVACITTICISAQWLTSLKWGLIDSQSRSTKMLYSYLLLMKVYLFELATRFEFIWPRPIFKGSSDPSHFIFETTSEGGGSDIERLWIWMNLQSILTRSRNSSSAESLYVGSDCFRHWFQKENALGLPLKSKFFYCTKYEFWLIWWVVNAFEYSFTKKL